MAGKLIIEIDLGNEAMQTARDAHSAIERALYAQASSVSRPFNEHETGTIRDENGNTVGRWEVQ